MQLVGSIHRGIVETVSLAVLRDLAIQTYGLAVDDMTVELQPGDERSLGFRRAGTIRKFLGLIRVQVDVVGMVTVDNDLVLRFRDVTSRATMKGVAGWPARLLIDADALIRRKLAPLDTVAMPLAGMLPDLELRSVRLSWTDQAVGLALRYRPAADADGPAA